MRSNLNFFIFILYFIKYALSQPPIPCPAPINSWHQGQQSPSTLKADSYFCYIHGTTDKAKCTALRAYVSDIRDDNDAQFIAAYLRAVISYSHNLILPFRTVVGLVKVGDKHFWDDNCLQRPVPSLFSFLASLQPNDTYAMEIDGSVAPASLWGNLKGILCRYDMQPCNREEYSQTCQTTCMANDSCFVCGNVMTPTTNITTSTTATATVTSTTVTTTTTPQTMTKEIPPFDCPYPISDWTEGVQSQSTILANSYFCFVTQGTDKIDCNNIQAFVSDIRGLDDSQFIYQYLQGIKIKANGAFTPFPAIIGLVKTDGNYFWNDDCLNPAYVSLLPNFISSTLANDTWVMTDDGSLQPKSLLPESPTGILCRYDMQPCNRLEYSSVCTNGRICKANGSCYSCATPTPTTTIANRPSTKTITTKSTTPQSFNTQLTAKKIYDNPFAMVTLKNSSPEEKDQSISYLFGSGYKVVAGIAVAVLILVVIILIFQTYATMNH